MGRATGPGETRAAILAAARSRFAVSGFRATTIRAIARDVGIDPALVMRHYGTKAGLFAAAVDVDLQIPDLREVPEAEHGQRLVRHFLSRWDAGSTDGQVLLILLRSASVEPAVAARMRELFADQLVPALARAVRDPVEVPQRAGLVASQMLGLALTRSVLELPPMASMAADAVIAAVGETVQRYLHGPAVPADGPARRRSGARRRRR